MREAYVGAAGSRIRMVEEGSGPPVLYVHGNTGSARWFERVMEIPGMRTVALDMPNFGRSDPLPGEVGIERYADAVFGFAEAIGLESFILVGHSLGGAVAMSLAIRHPRRVRGLLLVDSAAPSGLKTPESRHPLIEAMRADRSRLEAALRAVAPGFDVAVPGNAEFFASLVDDGTRMAGKAWIGNAVALGEMDFGRACASFGRPVLVVWGRKDIVVSEAMARETAAAFPVSRLELIEDLGHSLPIEDPARFKRILSGFAGEIEEA
jgi:branched-chain amino acid transport system permease protein